MKSKLANSRFNFPSNTKNLLKSKRPNSRFNFPSNTKNLLKSKRSQLKIQEMSFMLLGLVLFFIIAGLFFLVVSNAGLQEDVETLNYEKAVSTITRLAGSPELSCGKQLCVDADKLVVLKQRESFKNFWDINGLVVKKIYPSEDEEIECFMGTYENCNTFTLKEPEQGFIEVSSYVTLCKKDVVAGYSYDKCQLAKISAYIEK